MAAMLLSMRDRTEALWHVVSAPSALFAPSLDEGKQATLAVVTLL